MSKPGVKFETITEQLMMDEEFRLEYEKLKPRYEVISQFIEARNTQHMTQEELALRVGTQKSNISQFESGIDNPTLDFNEEKDLKTAVVTFGNNNSKGCD